MKRQDPNALSRESIEARLTHRLSTLSPRRDDLSTFNVGLVPKAYAFIPDFEEEHPFARIAKERVPTPAYEDIEAAIGTEPEYFKSTGTACQRATPLHLGSLEATLEGRVGVTILTLNDEPVASLKHERWGSPTILSFRYARREDDEGALFPLIPGGIYLGPEDLIEEAQESETHPIDDHKFYPTTMIGAYEGAHQARRTYARAERYFQTILGE